MCLWIKQDQEENKKNLNKWFGSRKRFAYVYKILRKWPEENFYRSPVYDFKWDFKKQKVFQVDRPNKPTKEELNYGEIHKGLHVYTSLKKAKENQNFSCDTIIEFKVSKENIVAIEINWSDKEDNFQELVCRKLEFVKVVEN
jgi:hypothetical protein